MRNLFAITLMMTVAAPAVAKAPAPVSYAAALASVARPEGDKAKDATRKPQIVLNFMQVKPGQKVGDFVTGGGYFSRILAGAVGPAGKVYAFQPDEFAKFSADYAKVPAKLEGEQTNIKGIVTPFAAPAFPEPLDAIVTIQNFHDLYLKPFPADTAAKASAALYAALKPGGVLVVVDHAAPKGTGTTAADGLHRIEASAVVDALTKAGFKLEASDYTNFADKDDPRTANVFDKSIRGKTDQFMLRFRKR